MQSPPLFMPGEEAVDSLPGVAEGARQRSRPHDQRR
jgi:hypothetical protein